MTLDFYVHGDPMPKGSTTRAKSGFHFNARRPAAQKKFETWMESVASHAKVEWLGMPRFDGPCGIFVLFYLRRPKRETKAQRLRVWHTTPPDADKLLRAVCDALVAADVLADDSRIAYARVQKFLAPSESEVGARISITMLSDGE